MRKLQARYLSDEYDRYRKKYSERICHSLHNTVYVTNSQYIRSIDIRIKQLAPLHAALWVYAEPFFISRVCNILKNLFFHSEYINGYYKAHLDMRNRAKRNKRDGKIH